MSKKEKNGGWLFWRFLCSGFYGFPSRGRWLRRVKGAVCNGCDRFDPQRFGRFLTIPYGQGYGRGAASAAALGRSLEGRKGAFWASAGFLTPWLLGELLPEAAAWWCAASHPQWVAVCLALRAGLLATVLLGALDFEVSRGGWAFLAAGAVDAVFWRVPGVAVLLPAALYEIGTAGAAAKEMEDAKV